MSITRSRFTGLWPVSYPAQRLRRSLGSLLILWGAARLLTGSGQPAQADSLAAKSDTFLARQQVTSHTRGWSSVIIRVEALTAAQQAQLRSLGADVYRHLPLIHSLALRIPTRNLPRLAALPFVRHLSADSAVRKCDDFTVGSSGAGIAWQAPYNLSGSGVAVAVVDSGIRPCQDLASTNAMRVIAAVNFVPPAAGQQPTTTDLCGHGTHIAGIIGGNGAGSTGPSYFDTYYGIAPKADLVNIRVLDDQGQGTVSNVISGIQWAINNQKTYHIRVLNLSLGHPVGESYTTDPLCQTVEQAWHSGIVVVCAAGNMGRLLNLALPLLDNEGYGTNYGSIQSPGNDPYVITVGATKSIDGKRADDRIATYSSRGPTRLDLVLKPDIIAPGNKVISLSAMNTYLYNAYSGTNQIPWSAYCTQMPSGNSVRYFRLSGTSMASPVVAGAAALMLQAQPGLSPDTVKARLMLSADKWLAPDGTANPCTYGAGYLNIPAALNSTAVATQPALSPTLSQDLLGNVYINLDPSLWGTRAIWGTGITDLRAIWGTWAIWGPSNTKLTASQMIWGTSVWSDRAIWGTSTGGADLSSIAIYGE